MTNTTNPPKKQTLCHADMSHFAVKKNTLVVGEFDLFQIEKLVGQTPFYAYDKAIITHKVSQLKQALPPQVELHYAIKANPYPSLVHFMSSLVAGFDVASKKEMLLALQSGVSAKDISFAGPGKTEQDIEAAIIAGVTLHVESPTEINRILSIAQTANIKPQIAIRVNPSFELKASGMTMGGGAKPFGIDEEQLPNILANLPYDQINFRGFHIYAGSQNLNTDAIKTMHSNTFKLAADLVNLVPVNIDYINIGGGLGIPYFPGEKNVDITPISEHLSHLMTEHKHSIGKVKIVMELGRYLVAEAGIYVSRIVDIKTSRGTKYLVCDGGLHHHLANSGNFGQVIRKNYPVAIGNKIVDKNNNSNIIEEVTIVGPLCTPLDIIANKVNLPQAAIGDFILVYQSGAYGASASPQQFLSQPALSEILL